MTKFEDATTEQTRQEQYQDQIKDADRQLKDMHLRALEDEKAFIRSKTRCDSATSSASSEDDDELRSNSSGQAEDDGDLSLPTGVITAPNGQHGPRRYENCFHRVKLMQSEIIVERGITRRLAECGKEVMPSICHDSTNYIITDTIVDELFGERILSGLRSAGLDIHKIVVPADALDETGESSAERHKTLKVFSDCVDQILERGIDKRSAIISLGGGVVNNIAGFIAASLYRGITLVHFSTTTMGQVDAAIDFKQAVNHHKGKNLLGAYHPATTIILDPELLQTLSRRHLLNGISESIKHAITQSQDMLDYVLQNRHMLDDKDQLVAYLEHIIRMTIAHKVPTLSGDTANDYNEMLPQYGHAIGHAVEFLSLHMPESDCALLHGEAIAVGMCITAEVAFILGVCTRAVVDKHYAVFEQMGLPVYVPRYMSVDVICRKMCYDKHYVKQPTMGLAVDIGEMYEKDGAYGHSISSSTLRQALLANIKKRDATNALGKSDGSK
ncbi:3-dehydroquinate synthase [Salpingoeca rosetta]|uniref:3-dehydroquinate synthase n=1 Tax=Salpingoeca rosetta (strain ATCC 50818 / BSB-021) TaxID=946362 RepID=F2UG87_SALR5|nr:3-dehydroquinate synthase [Salpingoeca rosetta]EGD75515.1 3-dehydroquinate synthase [Salpingoeca rosetta]|eukprot:XP_004991972.1 3-dehydroquinate synthase [Salpingoeca rosetta]